MTSGHGANQKLLLARSGQSASIAAAAVKRKRACAPLSIALCGRFEWERTRFMAKGKTRVVISEPMIIASWKKNAREQLLVRLASFKGQQVVDVRAWYRARDRTLKPGRGGLTVSIRHLPALAIALANAVETAAAAGVVLSDTIEPELLHQS